MAEFARYYITFLTMLFTNIGIFFKARLQSWNNIFTIDIPRYIRELSTSAPTFGAGGWMIYILVFIISFICLFFIAYRIVQLLRRYVFFRAKEVEKDQLMEELAKAKDKIAKLTIEKNQLYALKVNSIYPNMGYNQSMFPAEKEEITAVAVRESRFARLTAIDKKYEIATPFVSTAEADGWTLSQIVDKFVNFAASQHKLYYKKDVIRCFFAGVSTTKVIILEGISGTGKTSLPYALGKFFAHPASIISIQPSWRDRGDLMGYLNEFTKTFNESDFLSALYEATYREDPSIIILDEMNLARIEYYFAEFLSIMEMPDKDEWSVEVVATSDENDPKHISDGKILVPQSLWFVGTANQDDSTFTITDKVYDRTITIDLNNRGEYFDAPTTESVRIPYDYLEYLFFRAVEENPVSDKFRENLKKVDEYILDKFKITFGNRIMKQILNFIPVYVACGGTEVEAVDFLLKSKIFRKFNALNLVFLKKELNALIVLLETLFGKNKCPMSSDYLRELIRKA